MIFVNNLPKRWHEIFQRDLNLESTPSIEELNQLENNSQVREWLISMQKKHPILSQGNNELLSRHISRCITYCYLLSEDIINENDINDGSANIISLLKAVCQCFDSPRQLEVFLLDHNNRKSLAFFCGNILTLHNLNDSRHADYLFRNVLSALIQHQENIQEMKDFLAELNFACSHDLSLNDLVVIGNHISDYGFKQTSEKVDEAIRAVSFESLSMSKIFDLISGDSSDFLAEPVITAAVRYLDSKYNAENQRECKSRVKFFQDISCETELSENLTAVLNIK